MKTFTIQFMEHTEPGEEGIRIFANYNTDQGTEKENLYANAAIPLIDLALKHLPVGELIAEASGNDIKQGLKNIEMQMDIWRAGQ